MQDKIHDKFVEKLKSAMSTLVVGDGMSENTTQGPLINKNQFLKVNDFIFSALDKDVVN